jgi:hypothetical protein
MLNYGIEAFYPSPQYNDFCNSPGVYEPYPVKSIQTGTNCTFNPSPRQSDECSRQEGGIIADTYDANGCALTYKCDFCNKKFNDAQKAHSKIVFIISLIAGMLTLIVGWLFLTFEPVGSALMASGIGAFVYGSIMNWNNLSDIWRFLLLLVSLILLIWIAYMLNKSGRGFFGFGGKKKK